METIKDLIYKNDPKRREEEKRLANIEYAKYLCPFELDIWNEVYNVEKRVLATGMIRYFLLNKENNIIDSFDC